MTSSLIIKGFHATSHELKELNYDTLLSHRTNHANGALGLWCAFSSDWIKGFGDKTYEVTVEGSCYNMTIKDLSQLANTFHGADEYTKKRAELLDQGYSFIKLLEKDGSCEIFVVLDFTKASIKPV